ncbi:MAG: hypothetical protein IT189_12105 [Microbacteriaceae bacterium]|nr:hypothetical protein [Microbacteriaceae bacterium]
MSTNRRSNVNEQETREHQADGMQATTDAMKEIVSRISDRPAAKVVFGEPIAEGGVTVIPVARVSYGVGGGGGGRQDSASDNGNGNGEQRGGGGGVGGGLMASPAGYIEMRGGTTSWHPITSPWQMTPLVLVGGMAAGMILGTVRKLIRG